MDNVPNPPPWSLEEDKEILPEYWEHREFLTDKYYTEEQEVYPHDRAFEMGAACAVSAHGQVLCGNYKTCIQCAAEWGQREDQEYQGGMANDLQAFERITRSFVISAAHVNSEDYVPTGPYRPNIHCSDRRDTDFWDRRHMYSQLIEIMNQDQNLMENLAMRGVMRVKKQFIHELAGNITWTADNQEAMGRLAYDWGHFVVRKAVVNHCTGRETVGYIFFRHVQLPIQQLVFSALQDQGMEQGGAAMRWRTDSVRDKIQAIMALAYHYHCKKTHTGIANGITPDVMAALAPVAGVMNMIENAIVYHIKMQRQSGMLEPFSIGAKFRLSQEEMEVWDAHRQARADSEAIMRYRETVRAAPAAPWTSLAMELAGEGMTFSISGQQRENWTDHYRITCAQDVPVPPVGFTINGQDPEALDSLHLQVYTEQLINIIGQKRQRRIMGEYLARVRNSSGR